MRVREKDGYEDEAKEHRGREREMRGSRVLLLASRVQ